MNKDNALSLIADKNYNYSHQLWLRIVAFLETKAPETQRTYASVVREWTEFLGGIPGTEAGANLLLKCNDLHVIAYKRWLENQPGQTNRQSKSVSDDKSVARSAKVKERRDGLQSGLANATINKKLSALRRIYRVLIAADLNIKTNPFDVDRVPPPSSKSGQRRPTEMLNFEDVKRLLEFPNIETAIGKRDQAILAVLFGGGLRRSEVVNLSIGDFRKTPQGTYFLRLRATKGRKDSDQTIPDWAAKTLLDWKAEREQHGALSADPLFCSFRGRSASKIVNTAISDSGLYKLFKNYCKLAGFKDYLTPHSARATAITKLLDDGFDHREVQEFSRHSSIQMVEVYDKRRIGVENNPGKKLKY